MKLVVRFSTNRVNHKNSVESHGVQRSHAIVEVFALCFLCSYVISAGHFKLAGMVETKS